MAFGAKLIFIKRYLKRNKVLIKVLLYKLTLIYINIINEVTNSVIFLENG